MDDQEPGANTPDLGSAGIFNALQAVDELIYVFTAEGEFQYWNDALSTVTGYSDATIAVMDPTDFFVADDREHIANAIRGALDNKYIRVEATLQTKAGDRLPYEFSAVSFTHDSTELVAGVGRDITDRKKREEHVRIYEYAFESALSGIAIANVKGGLRLVNPAFYEMWGYDDEEDVLGHPVTDFWAESEVAASVANAVQETGGWEGELRAVREDGTAFDVYATASHLTGDEGEPIALMSSFVDITERKEHEQELQEQRDNLELLNQVVRHDIRNDMTVVRGRANLLEDHIEREDEAWEDLQAIHKSTADAIELTKTAGNLAETMLGTQEDIEAVRLDQHLDSVIENARSTYIDAIIIVDEEMPEAKVIGNELLEAVFRNLVQNAVVHNDNDTPEIHISTTLGEETLTVVVADNGPGIPDNQKEEIFGKGEKGLDSPGTGIGLYLVQTLVEQYGGDVWVEDNDPEGSAFVVELPNADAEED